MRRTSGQFRNPDDGSAPRGIPRPSGAHRLGRRHSLVEAKRHDAHLSWHTRSTAHLVDPEEAALEREATGGPGVRASATDHRRSGGPHAADPVGVRLLPITRSFKCLGARPRLSTCSNPARYSPRDATPTSLSKAPASCSAVLAHITRWRSRPESWTMRADSATQFPQFKR